MIPFFGVFVRFARTIRTGWTDEEFRSLLITVAVLLGAGTWFYSVIEDWSVGEALYFSVITLTTVGYGDLTPTHPFTKAFTVFFVLMGVGLLLVLVNKIAQQSMALRRLDDGDEE